MRFFNTLRRRMEEFVPLVPGEARFYTCGPTVYDYAHIGNFRAYLFEDLLRRWLKFKGYKVTQVMNLTDVDDKTIRGAASAGMSLMEYTKKYKDAFFEDLRRLNIEPAEHYPAATDHIPDMIALIGKLMDKGFAYRSDDGSVYFSIAKFGDYGKLAHLDVSGLRAGARVAHDEYEKENLADFALWKAWDEKDGDVAWESPWGKGRPGWHIECSAMSMHYLGETLDIHTGGIDNIFPHHEDEKAQSEAANGKTFVNYWMHCAHLIVEGKKMSKSLGNFFTLRDIVKKGYNGREIRYCLVSGHYRQSLNFTFEALDAARSSLARIDEFVERLSKAGSAGAAGGSLPDWAERARTRFVDAMDEDLSISEALASLFDMIHDGNKAMDSATGPVPGSSVLGLIRDMDRLLGFVFSDKAEADDAVRELVNRRESARKSKNWAESDLIRKQLAGLGWEVKDTPDGPRLRKI